jgi:hypothetical protein
MAFQPTGAPSTTSFNHSSSRERNRSEQASDT